MAGSWLSDIFASFFTAQDQGVAKPARAKWNFGQGIVVTDNEPEGRLDITVPTTTSTEAGLLPITTGADKAMVATAGNAPTWAKIVNANIDAAAAIAGSKIEPNFGAQALAAGNATLAGTLAVASYTVAGVPSASPAGQTAYISNETGGAVLAFSDGVDWRRVTDRAVIS